MANGYESGINKGSISGILQLIEGFGSGHEREKQSIGMQHEAVKNLLATAQTPAQIANAKQALNNIKDRSLKYDSTALNYTALENVMENQSHKFNEYSTGLTQADEFLKSGEYKPKASDWMDLDATRASLVNDEGQPLYESNLDMLNNEYVRISKIEEKLSLGLHPQTKEKLFRMPSGIGDGTFDEDDIADKLTRYKANLDKALTAMMGDDSITEEEAAAISNGMLTPAALTGIRTKKMAEFADVIGKTDSMTNYIQKLNFDNLTDSDIEGLGSILSPEIMEGIKDSHLNGDTTSLKKLLSDELSSATIRGNKARQGYKNWSGSWYADEATDSVSLIDEADDDGDGVVSIEEKEEAELAADFEEMDKEELEIHNKDLMERYGTTDPDVIKKYLSGELKESPEKSEKRENVTTYDERVSMPANEQVDYHKIHQDLEDEALKNQPDGFGYGYPPGIIKHPDRLEGYHGEMLAKSNILRERDEILDGVDESSVALQKYLSSNDKNFSYKAYGGNWKDGKKKKIVQYKGIGDKIIGRKNRNKVRTFQVKYQKWANKNPNLTMDDFIAQNKKEYVEISKIIKYGFYWSKEPANKLGKHYQNLYDSGYVERKHPDEYYEFKDKPQNKTKGRSFDLFGFDTVRRVEKENAIKKAEELGISLEEYRNL